MSPRRTKIIATIGPGSYQRNILKKLVEAGMDVARINFSHGTREKHAAAIAALRELSTQLNKPICILQDLQGPKLRLGSLLDGVNLEKGQIVRLSKVFPHLHSTDRVILPADIPNPSSIPPGSRVLVDDGRIELETIESTNQYVDAKVIVGGTVTAHKGINLPGANLDIPCLTEKDLSDLRFGLAHNVDVIAVSFVRVANDIIKVRQAISDIDPRKSKIPIIAKLERPEAIENLHDILTVSDGVMIARGDLAVETSPAIVPIVQKKIIQRANRQAKYVITATQMLESMVNNPRPTRAEASDVANAIFDGTDAVMLSAETAIGKYPVESIQIMHRIIEEAENHFCDWGLCDTEKNQPVQDDAISITRAARELAHDRNVAAIAVFTQTGKTALLMSKARPEVPILAFTPEKTTYQLLNMYWGVTPYMVPYANTVEKMILEVENCIAAQRKIKKGQQVVIISGFPVGTFRPPNFALLHTIGQL